MNKKWQALVMTLLLLIGSSVSSFAGTIDTAENKPSEANTTATRSAMTADQAEQQLRARANELSKLAHEKGGEILAKYGPMAEDVEVQIMLAGGDVAELTKSLKAIEVAIQEIKALSSAPEEEKPGAGGSEQPTEPKQDGQATVEEALAFLSAQISKGSAIQREACESGYEAMEALLSSAMITEMMPPDDAEAIMKEAKALEAAIKNIVYKKTENNENKVDRIDVQSYQKNYKEGLRFDKSSVVATAHYEDGTVTPIPVEMMTIAPDRAFTATDDHVTITYKEGSVRLEISIEPKNLTRITANATKTEYEEGEAFDKSGLTVTAEYDNGEKIIIDNYKLEITPNGKLTPADKQILISYKGAETSVKINVTAKPSFGELSEEEQTLAKAKAFLSEKISEASRINKDACKSGYAEMESIYNQAVIMEMTGSADTTTILNMANALDAAIKNIVYLGTEPGTTTPEADTPESEDEEPIEVYANIYSTEKTTLKGFRVEDFEDNTITKPIKFTFYNATLQRMEHTVTSVNGVIPDLKVIKGHNYIVRAEDSDYVMLENIYFNMNKTLNMPINTKDSGTPVSTIYLAKRSVPEQDPSKANRFHAKFAVKHCNAQSMEIDENYDFGTEKIRFTSPAGEVIEAPIVNGMVEVDLIEDVNYMVSTHGRFQNFFVMTNNEGFVVKTFPVTIKDHSEFGAEKMAYTHLTCGAISELYVIDKDAYPLTEIKEIESNTKRTKINGFNFMNGQLGLHDRHLKKDTVKGLEGKDYEVIDIDGVNLYRNEISKLALGDFRITTKIKPGKRVANVYYVDAAGKLQKTDGFTQDGDSVTFLMHTLSMYNNVIEYAESDYVNTEGGGSTWTKGSKDTLRFRFALASDDETNDTYEKFTGLALNGKDVPTDAYRKSKGSVILELKPEYLETLSPAEYTLTAKFEGGKTADATFTVAERKPADANVIAPTKSEKSVAATSASKTSRSTSVKTGDAGHTASYLLSLTGALALVLTLAIYRRRNTSTK